MADGIDFRLSKNTNGIYDISFNDSGDIQGLNSFDTAILMTVFCERRAESSEVPNNSSRRGWWGNLLSRVQNFEIGSKAWLLEQARKTEKELNLAITYYQTAFNWFIEDQYAQSIRVDGNLTASGIAVKITINVPRDNVSTPFFDLWLGTGVNVQVNVQ
jgi:phage gp46-like protein